MISLRIQGRGAKPFQGKQNLARDREVRNQL